MSANPPPNYATGQSETLSEQINSLENYQQHSRLHFIGQWKTKMKDYLRHCYEEHPEWNHGDVPQQRTFIHLDLDAFFCSVQLAKPQYAHLREKPVAISAGRGNSDVSSCNYIARRFGVHAGMYVNQAKELCPDLVTLGYDFEACRHVIKTLYRIIFEHFPASHKMTMEVYSVDDVMIASDTEDMGAMETFCNTVRAELRAATGCTVSCGIGPNILLSRLVTTLAKPDGVYVLSRDRVKQFIAKTAFSSLHGVGSVTFEKVKLALLARGLVAEGRAPTEKRNKKGISCDDDILCEDVQRLSEKQLQAVLGQKMGSNFHRLCRGDDSRLVIRTGDVEAEETLKRSTRAVGCSMNYAVRPSCEDDVWKIIQQVLQDVCLKLERQRVLAGALRLTVLERHPLHSRATQKFLGRGKCIEVHLPIHFPHPMGHDQCEQMLRHIKDTLSPLLVMKRPDEMTDERRAALLGVGDEDQTIWTVSLPEVSDLLVEDLRGFTIQASKLQPSSDQDTDIHRRKRMRDPPDRGGAQQRTLSEMLLQAPSGTETIISSEPTGQPIRRSECPALVKGCRRGRFGLAAKKLEDKDYESFALLFDLEMSEAFTRSWESVCAAACQAKDYFMVRACLRCAAMKILQQNETSTELAKQQLGHFEQFAFSRLPFVLEYW